MKPKALIVLLLVASAVTFALYRHRPAAPMGTPPTTIAHQETPAANAPPPATNNQATSPTTAPTPTPETQLPASTQINALFASIPNSPFRSSLLNVSETARHQALQKLIALKPPKEDYQSLRATNDGELIYVCAFPSPPTTSAQAEADFTTTEAQPEIAAAAVPIASPPIRHSRPGATKILYLDFNGHAITGTYWNEADTTSGRPAVTTYQALPYDTDNDPANFSDVEQTTIVQIWERVSEDYSPFDVDVTTEEPATFTRTTGRALVTRNTDANGVAMPSSSSGGVAVSNVFGGTNYATRYSPAFIYFNNISGGTVAGNIAEAISHELGHNFGLSHDGKTDGTE